MQGLMQMNIKWGSRIAKQSNDIELFCSTIYTAMRAAMNTITITPNLYGESELATQTLEPQPAWH